MTTIVLEGKEYLLNVDQAEKLGLLKKKDNKVMSWNEFKEKYRNECGYFYEAHKNRVVKTSSPISMCNQLTPHESQALIAFTKLLKLRRDWIGEWEPDWENTKTKCYTIECIENTLRIYPQWIYARSLSFPTQPMAQEFLETFRDLIEEAKRLI